MASDIETHNEKRLLCFSIINDDMCTFLSNCSYAHSLAEQKIDIDKMEIYKIIIADDFVRGNNYYKKLLTFTNICTNCEKKKCTGGYNCRNGVFTSCLKICRNDLLTGQCINNIINISIDQNIIHKIIQNNDLPTITYQGCFNGHHMSLRGIVPYYQHINNNENFNYQSTRYIDVYSVNKILKNNNKNIYLLKDDNSSDSSSDEDINNLFKK